MASFNYFFPLSNFSLPGLFFCQKRLSPEKFSLLQNFFVIAVLCCVLKGNIYKYKYGGPRALQAYLENICYPADQNDYFK